MSRGNRDRLESKVHRDLKALKVIRVYQDRKGLKLSKDHRDR